MSIYTAKGHQALRDEVMKLCEQAVQTYRDLYIGSKDVGEAVVPPVPTPEPVLRELKFSDGYTYRWNGRLEFASKLRDEWVASIEVPMDDFDTALDLREKPYV
jgi:hypothetical protein